MEFHGLHITYSNTFPWTKCEATFHDTL